VQVCFTSKTDFFSSKHDPSKLGRVVDALGVRVDGKGALSKNDFNE
jgi:F0F1-type ATP synthase alpha subunit